MAPFNIPSLKDKFAQQMEIAAMKKKYGGVMCYVFVKHLHEQEREWEMEQNIPMQDENAAKTSRSKGWRRNRDFRWTGWLVSAVL